MAGVASIGVGTMATEVTHRIVDTNGIRMHLAESGAGPLVPRRRQRVAAMLRIGSAAG